jgi:hypothetical protein
MITPDLDDMFAPDIIADPHRHYAHLRELDPVHWNERYQLWVVTRYDDVVWMIRRHELFSSAVIGNDPRPPYPPIDPADADLVGYVRRFRADQLVEHDRPAHLAMRSVVHEYFTPRTTAYASGTAPASPSRRGCSSTMRTGSRKRSTGRGFTCADPARGGELPGQRHSRRGRRVFGERLFP